jgi:putative peptidoglycan lipid II flippase
MPSKRQMLRSSMVVGFFSLLGGLTGILVDTSIAAKLGLSRSSDTFYVAFTVPYIITNLIGATGQFSLVPFFSSLEARHSAGEQWRGFSYAVSVSILGLAGIAALGAAGAPWLMRGIAPGITPAQADLAAHLGRWLFLIIIPAGVAEVFRSFLLSRHRFALSSAAGFFRNVTVIASIVILFPRYAEYSIVLGYLAGYLLQFAVLGGQIVVSFPARYSLTLAGSGEAFRNLRGAGTAQIGGAVAWQGVVVAERVIASFLPPGTITALNWGFKIMSSLAELLAGSLGTVSLPALSRAVAQRAKSEVRRLFQDVLEIGLTLVSPAMVFCLLLDRNIIRLVFERGRFTAQATDLLTLVFFWYTVSLLLYSFVRVFTFYLFARNESGTFFRLALVLYGLNVAFDLLYVGALRMGARGIPLGLLTSLLLTVGLIYRRNLGELKDFFDRALGIFTLKILLGAGLAALTVWGLDHWLQTPATGAGNFIFLCAVCGAGGIVFVATLAATRAVPIAHLKAVLARSDET